jgi:hypothetical protein
MYDVFPKFIVEGNNLIIGKCTFHKQLATDPKKVKGGGLWKWDQEKKEITLYGKSEDYGRVKTADIKRCIKSENVFFSYIYGRKVEGYTFYLNTGSETIKLN